MSKVFFKEINNKTTTEEIQEISKQLLDKIIIEEKIQLEKTIPLKVHFGEKGNKTFVKPDNFDGIIDFLQDKNIDSSFMETSVLYGGQRYKKDLHLKTAQEHGFTKLPVIIADGDCGENFDEIEINKKHFQTCKIGAEFSKYNQLIIVSHFKGHALAGFGGAIKQLAMGQAAKGGKMAMHIGMKPHIINKKCKKCNLCKTRCNVDAITIGEKSFIDHDKCIACGACMATCPYKAISIISFKAIYRALTGGDAFREKIAEYAYAAQLNKNNIYINFAMSITKGCDCEAKTMKAIMDDYGIFVGTDPVAIDKACWDMANQKGKKFKGTHQLEYAEKIGLGSTKYHLIEI